MSSIQQLANQIVRLERELRAQATTPQLAYSSIEDGGSIDSNADDGSTMAQFGGQFDGSFMAASLVGPTPPTPSAPIVTAAIGGLTVRWDGLFTDADFAPMDFTRVEVHVSTVAAFVPDTATTLVATIESPRGALPFIARAVGTYYVAFVARSQSGKAGLKSVTTAPTTVALIGNGALANPVTVDNTTGASNGMAITIADQDLAAATIAVPAGYSQALVFLSVTAAAVNGSAVTAFLYISAVINGTPTRLMPSLATSTGTASVSTAKSITLTGLSGGTISVAARVRTDNGWAANVANRVYSEAIVVFLR